jgi:hypothetical protein
MATVPPGAQSRCHPAEQNWCRWEEDVPRFAPRDKTVVKRVLDSLILSNEAKRWSSAS